MSNFGSEQMGMDSTRDENPSIMGGSVNEIFGNEAELLFEGFSADGDFLEGDEIGSNETPDNEYIYEDENGNIIAYSDGEEEEYSDFSADSYDDEEIYDEDEIYQPEDFEDFEDDYEFNADGSVIVGEDEDPEYEYVYYDDKGNVIQYSEDLDDDENYEELFGKKGKKRRAKRRAKRKKRRTARKTKRQNKRSARKSKRKAKRTERKTRRSSRKAARRQKRSKLKKIRKSGLKGKAKRLAKRQVRKEFRVKRKDLGGVGYGLKKVSMSAPRSAALSLIRLNYRGIASGLSKAPKNMDKVLTKWTQLGGMQTSLKEAIKAGKDKKPLFGEGKVAKKAEKAGFDADSNFYNAVDPATLTALIATGGGIIASVASAIGKNIEAKKVEEEAKKADAEAASKTAEAVKAQEEAAKAEAEAVAESIKSGEAQGGISKNVKIAIGAFGGLLLVGGILAVTMGGKKKK